MMNDRPKQVPDDGYDAYSEWAPQLVGFEPLTAVAYDALDPVQAREFAELLAASRTRETRVLIVRDAKGHLTLWQEGGRFWKT
ncbi:hypothetical protein [Haloferula sp. BvORR071]|uniref:hypothetical protein n=1 Tax=Haloferula sp. BvORR071 TaxID=1396141 RepID=UPI000553BC65|nr:hypothetical protein [Haloferula sp. BvORR071]